MSSIIEILTAASFGSRVAEDEVDDLHSYFVETEQWRKVNAGDVDIVFGSKGSGKSAIYSLLTAQKEHFRLGRRTMILAAENPRGTPAFRDLVSAPPMDEEHFRALWKLYFLSISADYLRHHLSVSKQVNAHAGEVISFLAANGLLAPNVTLISRLRAALEYLREIIPGFEGSVTDPVSGLKFTGKITLGEPTSEQRSAGFRSLDELLDKLNMGYAQLSITTWLALDRLDVAFSDSEELEGNAIRSLFRAYLDMLSLSHIKVKIFLRDDIWRKVVSSGFREASHVTRTLSLSWNQQSLLNLVVRRLASNPSICEHYKVRRDDVLSSAVLQGELFYKIFPDQIDIGSSKPSTLDWMLSRTADGTKRTAPRELIHLLLAIRDEQLAQYQLGVPTPDNDRLFDKMAIRAALPEVSKARYELTLCAENPALKPYVEKLEREKTQQSRETLSKLWKCSETKAGEIAEKLVETGFFERRGPKDVPSYWVPFLYRDSLDMIQGSAT